MYDTGELAMAAHTGAEQGALVILGDRAYSVTIQRCFDQLRLYEKLKLLVSRHTGRGMDRREHVSGKLTYPYLIRGWIYSCYISIYLNSELHSIS